MQCCSDCPNHSCACRRTEKWTDFRDEVVAMSRAIAVAQSQPTPMDIGAVSKGKSGKGCKEANVTIRLSKHVPGAETRITLLQTVLTLTKTFRKCGKVGHLASVCRSSETPQPKANGGQRSKGGGKGANAVKTCWNCCEGGHMSSQCPNKKVHSVEEIHHCESGWSPRHNHGWIGRKLHGFLRIVREGESVDIEIDSAAEVSCLSVNIGADTYPLHEMRLSMCGGPHVAVSSAPGSWVWRLQTCEAML